MSDEPRQPTYRDAQLHTLMKALRASVRPFPSAKLALEKVEGRLRYVLRVIESWDDAHARRARELMRLDCIPAANTAASLIFDAETRQHLLALCCIGGDDSANERVAEAAELGREVLL